MAAEDTAPPRPGPPRDRTQEARELVTSSVERCLSGLSSPFLLLSGGLDTSIIAEVGTRRGLRRAVTVLVGPHPPDESFAAQVAARGGMDSHVVRASPEDLLQEVPFVVRTMRSFDPMEIRNSIVVARGLREVRALGGASALTGDGADELFAGYSYLWSRSEEEFARTCERLRQVMRFSAFPLGEALGLTVRAPFLDPEIVELSRTLTKTDLVADVEGTTHGKYLLRRAFPEVPNRWRRKDPIEVGSGSRSLTAHFQERIDPGEFARERDRALERDHIRLRDPEHLAYYRAFREVFGDHPPLSRSGRDPCTGCGFDLPDAASDFCVTCGAWPARTRPPTGGEARS